ncbi:MAG: STAS domain-containing protein [Nitrospinae bacterium]|nr:STAS domain-containing protein [Nitrospinota bacterium]
MIEITEECREKKYIVVMVNDWKKCKYASSLMQFIREEYKEELCSVFLDLKKVEFINSTFINALVVCYKELEKSHVQLYLLNVNDFVARTLKVTGLESVLKSFDSKNEALKSIGKC